MSPEILASASSLPSLSSAFQILKPLFTFVQILLKIKGIFS
ncbi:hypothetical protein [Corynebacterium silvaticum]|nr:hypothetical protein [Corynebacterium silvaticum]